MCDISCGSCALLNMALCTYRGTLCAACGTVHLCIVSMTTCPIHMTPTQLYCLTGTSQVLCATSSLAMGVNLPARLVVLKGTRRYADAIPGTTQEAGYQDYEQSVCLQMMGRAGRPQYDTEGVAVIMTERQVRGFDRVMGDVMSCACCEGAVRGASHVCLCEWSSCCVCSMSHALYINTACIMRKHTCTTTYRSMYTSLRRLLVEERCLRVTWYMAYQSFLMQKCRCELYQTYQRLCGG